MPRDSRIPAILFGTTLAMALVVVGAWMVGEGDWARTGESAAPPVWLIPHSTYPTMGQGGPGLERNGPVFWLGCAFALLQLVFYAFCLLLGMEKSSGPGPTVRPLLWGGLGWAVVWSGLFWSYHSYMSQDGASFVLGLPPATAWVLYGAWPYPVLFAIYFIYIFHDWFLRKQDLQRFRQLLAEREAGGSEDQE